MKRHTKTVKSFSKPPLTTNNNNNNTPLTSSVHAARSYDPDMLQMITPNAAGIDVASEEMWVCVPADRAEPNVRTFGAFTADLEAIADWLRQCRITSVAMESTGVYWIPLYQILVERGFDVCLTNARHLKNVAGRPKTDRLDCQWIQRLHSYGFLKASFRPGDAICQIRSIQRHREALIRENARHIQHMQKALHQMNVLLPKVVSDITGATGLAIIQKMLDGERNPVKLAKLRNPHCQSSEEEIAKALQGDYRREHVFVLRQAWNAYHFVQTQIRECDRELERLVSESDKQVDANQTPPPPREKTPQPPHRNDVQFAAQDGRTLLYECFGVDVTRIPGLDVSSALTLFTELGADLTPWPSAKHFASYLGLAPNVQSSAGKVRSSRTRKVASRAAGVFRLAAQAVIRSKTALGACYRRLKARLGGSKALTATAHKIAVIFYHMVKDHAPYKELGEAAYTQAQQARTLKRLKQRAKQLGYTLVTQPA
jgi:transposase